VAYFLDRVREGMYPTLEPILVGMGGNIVTHLLSTLVLFTGLSSQVLNLCGGLGECCRELGCVSRTHSHILTKHLREEAPELGRRHRFGMAPLTLKSGYLARSFAEFGCEFGRHREIKLHRILVFTQATRIRHENPTLQTQHR
jgi:hypothetical protein